MKKEDLRASLDRIRPREELIASTLTQMADVRRHEAEKKEKFVFATPAFSRSVRLAGAFCAFALVFCIGFVVARQSNLDPVGNQPTPVDSRVGGELDTSNVNNPNLALFTIEDQDEGEWIVVRGSVKSFKFADLTDEDEANGVLYRCIVDLYADSVENRSESFPHASISKELTANMVFYDNESLNALIDPSNDSILFRLVPGENEEWTVTDFTFAAE